MDLVRYIVSRFSRLLSSPWTWESRPPDKDTIGRLGEAMANRYLYLRGCKILYRNFKAPEGGEVDIVVRDGEVLGFVEVKTRTSEEYGRPALAVDLDKRRLISRGVRAWLHMLEEPPGWRCDIVEVILTRDKKPKIRWLKGAFTVEDTQKRLSKKKRAMP